MLKQNFNLYGKNIKTLTTVVILFAACFFCLNQTIQAQTTAFTYQGQLMNGGLPANGTYDFEFLLFNDVAVGTQSGTTLTRNGVSVVNGIFSVKLDFGAITFPFFADRFLEIHVRQTGGGGFTPLTPRQAITSTPYSIKSMDAINATNATNASQLGGVAANQYLTTTSGIQNTTSQQSANFNISGNGILGGSLGIGTIASLFKLQVIDSSNTGLRVQTNTAGGTVASFGGNGAFQIDAPFIPGGRFIVKESGVENGNVGIGITDPPNKLSVAGIVQSTSGGFKFPDGSVQTTAANTTFVNTQTSNVAIPSNDTLVSVLHLNLPSSGTYILWATVQLANNANFTGQNNSRTMFCRFTNDQNVDFGYVFTLAGFSFQTVTLHSSIPITGSNGVDLKCSGAAGQMQDSLVALQRRMTAVKIEGNVVVQ